MIGQSAGSIPTCRRIAWFSACILREATITRTPLMSTKEATDGNAKSHRSRPPTVAGPVGRSIHGTSWMARVMDKWVPALPTGPHDNAFWNPGAVTG